MNIEEKVWEILCSEEEIAQKVKELGERITKDYENKNLLVIALLKGSFIFAADLVRKIPLQTKMAFITTSSYGKETSSSGKVEIISDIEEELGDYDVLVVDDIIDSGLTMKYVCEHLRNKKPKTLASCVLLDKPSRRATTIEADYVGFTIEDRFVVGYGLNYGDYYRNIPYIFAVTDKNRE